MGIGAHLFWGAQVFGQQTQSPGGCCGGTTNCGYNAASVKVHDLNVAWYAAGVNAFPRGAPQRTVIEGTIEHTHEPGRGAPSRPCRRSSERTGDLTVGWLGRGQTPSPNEGPAP